MRKNNVKHGIAYGRAYSVRIKLVNFNDTFIYGYIAENFRVLLALFSEKKLSKYKGFSLCPNCKFQGGAPRNAKYGIAYILPKFRPEIVSMRLVAGEPASLPDPSYRIIMRQSAAPSFII